MKLFHCIMLIALTATAVVACSGKNEWTVDGRIEGAEGRTMVLEGSENGRWFFIDSIKINDTGQFRATHAATGYPDIYRLRLDDKTLYFPIDSIETVTVVTKADAFDTEYTLSGSTSADMLMAVDRKVMDAARHNGNSAADDSILKRELASMMLGNPSGIVSYYIINKHVHGVPLFDPRKKSDLRIIGAVANAFSEYRPQDPRTRYLTNLFLSNRNRDIAPADTIVASEINVIDIDLFDNHGKRVSLAKTADNNRLVILNFTAYGADFSPALNIALNKIYEKYRGQGLQIYQVSVDPNEVVWRETAKNLPWITVFKPGTDDQPLLMYNVGSVPLSFIIAGGEIVERVTDPGRLESAVSRRL